MTSTIRSFDVEFRLRAARLAEQAFLVSAVGELDLTTAAELSQTMAALDGRHARRLIVDLTEVTFLDSTALGTLLAEARSRRAGGDELVLVCDDPRTLRALEVTGLRAVFEVHRTLRDALDGAAR
jgi:anti-sigma B factor antagonist